MSHTSPAVNLLFVEDSKEDIELALRALKLDGIEARSRHVDSEAGMREALGAGSPDAILSDFSMPGFDGLHALRIARELAPEVPFIFVSGTIGEERAIEAIRLGATDYILKSSMRRLGTAVKRALSAAAERRNYEARIRHLANFDGLTDLPNRSLLADRTTQAIAHARRGDALCGLLVLNIDRFKLLNEGLGPAAGDALLRQFATRLRGGMSEGDTLARLGGDTFAVLVAGLARSDTLTSVARDVRYGAAAPFVVEGREVHLNLSLGASTYPRDAQDFEGLLANADAAMRRVKAAGGNGFQYYAAAMTSEAVERVELENALRAAAKRGELELHYQPQVDLATGQVCGVEALMRWRHPQRGPVSPAQFIPIAEESDLINRLGQWALHAACRQLAQWDSAGHSLGRMAVNVSARQFRSPGFAEQVAWTLREQGIHASRLELELTEGMLIDKREEAIAILNRLKAIGVQIAVDDFGTGYSNLSYLSSLPIDCLKIDRSFVMQTSQGGRHAAIAQAVISLGHSLGMRVLAEGVETTEQLEFLRRHGCDEYQGYLFARPQAAEAIVQIRAEVASKG